MTERNAILVVEDDPLVSEVIAAALDDEYSISIVETASEALTLLRAGGIRLMLLDCTLPGGVDVDLIPEADPELVAGAPSALADKPAPQLVSGPRAMGAAS